MAMAALILVWALLSGPSSITASTVVPTTVAAVTSAPALTTVAAGTTPLAGVTTVASSQLTTPSGVTTSSPVAVTTSAGTITAAVTTTAPAAVTTIQAATTVPAAVTTTAPQATTTPAQATTSASQGSCIQATVPDVMGLGACLQNRLDLCTGENSVRSAEMALITCTATSIFKNLSPSNALSTLRTVLVALLTKLNPQLGSTLDGFLKLLFVFNTGITDPVCHGEIKLGFPNSLGKCLNNTLMLCSNGTTIKMPLVQSLVSASTCVVTDMLTTSPLQMIRTLTCDLLQASKALFYSVPFGSLTFAGLVDICNV